MSFLSSTGFRRITWSSTRFTIWTTIRHMNCALCYNFGFFVFHLFFLLPLILYNFILQFYWNYIYLLVIFCVIFVIFPEYLVIHYIFLYYLLGYNIYFHLLFDQRFSIPIYSLIIIINTNKLTHTLRSFYIAKGSCPLHDPF